MSGYAENQRVDDGALKKELEAGEVPAVVIMNVGPGSWGHGWPLLIVVAAIVGGLAWLILEIVVWILSHSD